jgi:hypothetical protein
MPCDCETGWICRERERVAHVLLLRFLLSSVRDALMLLGLDAVFGGCRRSGFLLHRTLRWRKGGPSGVDDTLDGAVSLIRSLPIPLTKGTSFSRHHNSEGLFAGSSHFEFKIRI